jgi:hypothetical protein
MPAVAPESAGGVVPDDGTAAELSRPAPPNPIPLPSVAGCGLTIPTVSLLDPAVVVVMPAVRRWA